jgi:hypothetical protein
VVFILTDWLAAVDLREDFSNDLGCRDFRWSPKQTRNPAEMVEWGADWMLGRLVIFLVKCRIELD